MFTLVNVLKFCSGSCLMIEVLLRGSLQYVSGPPIERSWGSLSTGCCIAFQENNREVLRFFVLHSGKLLLSFFFQIPASRHLFYKASEDHLYEAKEPPNL